jgi:hypothetical protein
VVCGHPLGHFLLNERRVGSFIPAALFFSTGNRGHFSLLVWECQFQGSRCSSNQASSFLEKVVIFVLSFSFSLEGVVGIQDRSFFF